MRTRRRTTRRGLLLAVPALLLSACGGVDAPVGPPRDAAAPGAPGAGGMGGPGMGGGGMHGPGMGGPTAVAEAETRFMRDMIDHHLMAVRMGELCPTRAPHPELRALCARVVTTQRAEIALMRGWLQRWYGVAATPTLSPRDARALAGLAALDGAAFEIAWMQQMIPHHRMAIMMARQLLPRATHAELAELARTIVAAQSAEIRAMQGWLSGWYGRPPGHRGGMGMGT